jgi:FlaA1/EpsC-like NDP-sugar epimerase
MAQYALVYGGCGSLGSEAIRQFKVAGLKTISVDFAASKEAEHSIQIQGKSLDDDVKSILAEITKLNTGKDQFITTLRSLLTPGILVEKLRSKITVSIYLYF